MKSRTFSTLEFLTKSDFMAVSEMFPAILRMLNEVESLTAGEGEHDDDEMYILNQKQRAQAFQTQITCENSVVLVQMLHMLEARLVDAKVIEPSVVFNPGFESPMQINNSVDERGGGGDSDQDPEEEKRIQAEMRFKRDVTSERSRMERSVVERTREMSVLN